MKTTEEHLELLQSYLMVGSDQLCKTGVCDIRTVYILKPLFALLLLQKDIDIVYVDQPHMLHIRTTNCAKQYENSLFDTHENNKECPFSLASVSMAMR